MLLLLLFKKRIFNDCNIKATEYYLKVYPFAFDNKFNAAINC